MCYLISLKIEFTHINVTVAILYSKAAKSQNCAIPYTSMKLSSFVTVAELKIFCYRTTLANFFCACSRTMLTSTTHNLPKGWVNWQILAAEINKLDSNSWLWLYILYNFSDAHNLFCVCAKYFQVLYVSTPKLYWSMDCLCSFFNIYVKLFPS